MAEKKLIDDQSEKNLVCGLQVPGKAILTRYGCGMSFATPTVSHFGN